MKIRIKVEENEGMNIENQSEDAQQKYGYTFGSIMEMLPDIVGEANSRKVSLQTCFVTMLHLANEKILRLSPLDEEKDFFIEKDKTKGVN